MENFVLVHGAWHGAWCWAAVIRQLELAGDRAYAVDLPAHGANPLDPAKATRGAYVDSVVRFIEERNLRNVVLAGHSLGGMTIAGVAERIPERLKRVVFVTALVVPDGASAFEDMAQLMPPEMSAQLGGVGEVPAMGVIDEWFRANFLQDGSRDLQDFVLAALVPEPTAPMLERASLRDFYASKLPLGYLFCEDDLVIGDPKQWRVYASRLRNPTVRSLKCGHEVMFSQPLACARALAELARA